jgi:hypothetical protein
MAGTTGLEPATSAVTGQRSNQLNYVPNLFFYLYRKPASLVAFFRFKRFACVACFNPIEPNSEVNGHHGHHAKTTVQNCATGKHQPRAAVPAPRMNCSRANSDQYRLGDMLGTSDRNMVTEKRPENCDWSHVNRSRSHHSMASTPSFAMRGTMMSAETGSAHHHPRAALRTSPNRRIADK